MKTRKAEKEIRELKSYRKEDFSQYALDLGIWDSLVEGLPLNTDEVEVIIVSRRKAQ